MTPKQKGILFSYLIGMPIVFAMLFISVSCNKKVCVNLDIPVERKVLVALSKYCEFLKYYSDAEIYLINSIDSVLICDINTLFYYKEDNSRHILIFNSRINENYVIAVIQNGKLEMYPCADLFKICETHYPNKLIIEVQDSLLEFNSLSYGLHTLELLNKNNRVSYHYTDTIIYDNNY